MFALIELDIFRKLSLIASIISCVALSICFWPRLVDWF